MNHLKTLAFLVLAAASFCATAMSPGFEKKWEKKQYAAIEKEARALVAKGEAQGKVQLGLLAARGLTSDVGPKEGLTMLKEVADTGDAEAQFLYAQEYNKDPSRNGLEVRKYMQHAALGGHRDAYLPATFQFNAGGDYAMAVKFGLLTLKQGHLNVLGVLSSQILKGQGVPAPSPELAWALTSYQYKSIPVASRVPADAQMVDAYAKKMESPTYGQELRDIAMKRGPLAAVAAVWPGLANPQEPTAP